MVVIPDNRIPVLKEPDLSLPLLWRSIAASVRKTAKSSPSPKINVAIIILTRLNCILK